MYEDQTFSDRPDVAQAALVEVTGETETAVDPSADSRETSAQLAPSAPAATSIGGYTRYDNSDPALTFTGSWATPGNSIAAPICAAERLSDLPAVRERAVEVRRGIDAGTI